MLRWRNSSAARVRTRNVNCLTPLEAGVVAALSSQQFAGDRGRTPAPPRPGAEPTRDRIAALVELARDGDAEAFGQLYDHHVTNIYRFTYARTGSQHLAEDFTSETFTRALRSIKNFKWQGNEFGAWLTAIARNLMADHFKSRRHRSEVVTETMPDPPDVSQEPLQQAVLSQRREILMCAVNSLPAKQRDCILMRFVQGMSVTETAKVLGRNHGAVRQLQFRAIRALAQQLDGVVDI